MSGADMSQVDRLADDLDAAREDVLPKVRKVVERGALNVKNGMRRDADGHPRFRHFPRSIGYDVTHGGLGAEIGPDKTRRQGALGNLLYFGSSNNAPVLDLNGPLRKEEPRFEAALADVAEDVL